MGDLVTTHWLAAMIWNRLRSCVLLVVLNDRGGKLYFYPKKLYACTRTLVDVLFILGSKQAFLGKVLRCFLAPNEDIAETCNKDGAR